MRYRWDPAYPMGRRDAQTADANLRASDDERNGGGRQAVPPLRRGAPRRDRVQAAPRHRHVGHHAGRPQRAVRRPAPAPQRAATPAAAAPPDPALGLPRGLPRPRRRGDHPLLSPLPRALVPDRHRGLRAVAQGGGRPPAPPQPLRRRRRRLASRTRSWTTEPVHTHSPTPRPTATRPTPCAPWSSSPGSAESELARDRGVAATSPPPTPARSSRPRTCPSACWHVIAAGHAVVQRDGTPIGLLGRGDSWSEHSLLNQAALLHRRRRTVASDAVHAEPTPVLRDPRRATPCWPAAWWRGRPPRPTDWRCPSSTPWSHLGLAGGG